MSIPAATWLPHVGDLVMLRGTRVAAEVTGVQAADGQDRVMLKVTTVLGKGPGSKMARAWKGAWVTCPPDLLLPHVSPAASN
jgi:hypothetical protein